MAWGKKDKDKRSTRAMKKPEKKAEAKPKAKPKEEPKAKPVAKPKEVKPTAEVVHDDFGMSEPKPEPKPVPKPVPKPEPKPVPEPEGDQAVVTGHFDGNPALCVLSKTPAGYAAQMVRSAPSGPTISPVSPFPNLDASLKWARAVMSVSSVRMQAQVPVADVAKELA